MCGFELPGDDIVWSVGRSGGCTDFGAKGWCIAGAKCIQLVLAACVIGEGYFEMNDAAVAGGLCGISKGNFEPCFSCCRVNCAAAGFGSGSKSNSDGGCVATVWCVEVLLAFAAVGDLLIDVGVVTKASTDVAGPVAAPGLYSASHWEFATAIEVDVGNIVDISIAIAVDAIAGLRNRTRGCIWYAARGTAAAACGTDCAQTAQSGIAWGTVEAVIHGTVAVVVFCVTYFGRAEYDLITGSRAIGAIGYAGAAGCARCLTRNGAAKTASWVAFVGLSVAVIVGSVANFSTRGHILLAEGGTLCANHCTSCANALIARIASTTDVCRLIVGEAVAVVVEAIAHLSHGEVDLCAYQVAVLACELALRAKTSLSSNDAGSAIESFVRSAVAIIVDAIAGFSGRLIDLGAHDGSTGVAAGDTLTTCSLLARN